MIKPYRFRFEFEMILIIKYRHPDISDTGSCQNNLGNPYFFKALNKPLGTVHQIAFPLKFNEWTLGTMRGRDRQLSVSTIQGAAGFPERDITMRPNFLFQTTPRSR
jgi:hypothetical protein